MLTIIGHHSASLAEWNQVYRACSYSTFFHSPEWAEIWQRFSTGETQPQPEWIIFSDQKKVLLPFTFRRRGKGLLNTYTTSMEGTFGGWISADDLSVNHIAVLTKWLLHKTGKNISWRVNPYDVLLSKISAETFARYELLDGCTSKRDKALAVLLNFRQPVVVPDETHTLNLAPGFSTLFKSQSAVVRKAKKARKAGVTIKTATTLDEWKEYYHVYLRSLQRWNNTEGYDWALFQTIYECQSPNVKLWIAVYDNKIVCGALCFYSPQYVIYWHGCALEEYFELRPVNLLMLEAIQDACDHGHLWFDFNPSGGMQGVRAFKESFGAKPLECPLIYIDTPLKRLARSYILATKGYF